MKKYTRLTALVLAAALFIPGALASDPISTPITHVTAEAAVDISTKVALQEQAITAIKAIILAKAELVLDAQAEADPVRRVLKACWETKPNSFKQYEDLEAFTAENALAAANLLLSDEVLAAVAIARDERIKQEKLEAERAAKELARLEEERLLKEQQAARDALDYDRAVLMKESGLFDEAAELFLALGDYRDARRQALECRLVHNGAQYLEADDLMTAASFLSAYKKFASLKGYMDADARAEKALLSYIAGQREAALKEYSASTRNFRSLNELIEEINNLKNISPEVTRAYHAVLMAVALAALEAKDHENALILLKPLANAGFEGAAEALKSAQELEDKASKEESTAPSATRAPSKRIIKVTGGAYPFFIHEQGTVSGPAVEVYPDSAAWKDVKDAGSNLFFAAALHTSGRVSLAPNPRFYGEKGKFDLPLPDVSKWKSIIGIAVGANSLIGLDAQGRAFSGGGNSQGQRDIPGMNKYQAASGGLYHTLLLSGDKVTGYGSGLFNQLGLDAKTRTRAVAAGAYHSLALLPNGKVRAAGLNADGQCEVNEWKDIKAIAAGAYHSVGLKEDGTLVAVGINNAGQCEVAGWADVISLAAGNNYTIGLKSDGTVLTTAADSAYTLKVPSAWTSLPPTQWQSMSAEAAKSLYDFGDFKIGGLIEFGRYEQDNKLDNGPEPIAWRVLSIEGGRALLISEYALDVKPYHDKGGLITWDKSSMRAWLNKEFLEAAFNEEEQEAIPLVTLSNTNKNATKTADKPDTDDRVFLLSVEEAETYFKDNKSRRLTATAYTIARKAYVSKNLSPWWLRSTGASKVYAALIGINGELFKSGVSASVTNRVVRPAIYVNLE